MKNIYETLKKVADLYGATIRIAKAGEEAGVFLSSGDITEKIDIENITAFESEYECSYWDAFKTLDCSCEFYSASDQMPKAA